MSVNTTIDKDLGEKQIKKHIAQMNESYVTVGIHEGVGEYLKGVKVIDVAFWQEFGTKMAPERSFIRSTVDENKAELVKEIEFQRDQILNLKTTPKKVLNSLGFQITELIRGKIETLRQPPNAPATIAQKPETGDNPLVDSRLLKRSINFETTIKS